LNDANEAALGGINDWLVKVRWNGEEQKKIRERPKKAGKQLQKGLSRRRLRRMRRG
jgi:hypothetical protein